MQSIIDFFTNNFNTILSTVAVFVAGHLNGKYPWITSLIAKVQKWFGKAPAAATALEARVAALESLLQKLQPPNAPPAPAPIVSPIKPVA